MQFLAVGPVITHRFLACQALKQAVLDPKQLSVFTHELVSSCVKRSCGCLSHERGLVLCPALHTALQPTSSPTISHTTTAVVLFWRDPYGSWPHLPPVSHILATTTLADQLHHHRLFSCSPISVNSVIRVNYTVTLVILSYSQSVYTNS